MRRVAGGLVAAAVLLSGGIVAAAPPIAFEVRAVYPHDPSAFTQGLLYHGGWLYESTGLRGRSELRRVELGSGRVVARHRLAPELFGEGLARIDERLYQLTWQAGVGFVYAIEGLRPLRQFRYPGEGWGLASDGRRFWMSDGTSSLRLLDPETMSEYARLAVHDDGRPVERLNELEFVEGALFSNVWRTTRIARVDVDSGRVTGWLELAGLLGPANRGATGVLNGIAWDPERRLLLVTGKHWPRLFALVLK